MESLNAIFIKLSLCFGFIVSNLKPIIVLAENESSQNECSSQYIISGDVSWYYASNYEERYNYPYLYKPSSAYGNGIISIK